jgi:hypothetical protein
LLTRELPRRHRNAFFRTSQAAFEAASAQLNDDVPSLADSDVAVRILQLVAMLGDSHTFATGWPLRSFPIGVYWFEDGLTVIRAAAPHADLLGARIVAIDDRPIADVIASVRTVFPHENDAWLRHLLPSYVVQAEVLRSLRIADDAQSARFTFERADGARFDRTLEAETATATWVEPPAPLSRTRADAAYWAELLPRHGALYVKYNQCGNDPAKPFAAFVSELFASVANQPVGKLILDLRDNSGGDSSVLQPFITAVQSRPGLNRADRFFVLIGRRTFSSAILNAIQLDQQTNATLIGEPTGGKPNSHGEVLNFRLPFSGLTVWYSTKFFVTLPGQDPPSVLPQLTVPPSAAAWLAGTDPVLDFILPKVPKRRSARP